VLNRFLEKLSAEVGRRGFLGWAARSSAALALSLLGIPRAFAGLGNNPVACCGLLNPSTPGCQGSCCWCWSCCDSVVTGISPGHTFTCSECFTPCPSDACNTRNCLTSVCCTSYFSDCGISQHPNCSEAVCLGTSC
jgi:hypothetical protein